MNVYFISGMCVNCKVFDEIKLPPGYKKIYIEWYTPNGRETLQEYTRNMAKEINTDEPFILVGYSFGGIIMQEINKFLYSEKNILISSIKIKNERPFLFRVAQTSQILKYIPQKLYTVNKTLSNIFTKLIYNMSLDEIEKYVSHTSPAYMKWATYQITNWYSDDYCNNLWHIHGTNDQIFPYKLVKDVITIEDGDHLMVMRKADEINQILNTILLDIN